MINKELFRKKLEAFTGRKFSNLNEALYHAYVSMEMPTRKIAEVTGGIVARDTVRRFLHAMQIPVRKCGRKKGDETCTAGD